jgi:16S rRNA (guanine527-N7)-methyltransferase
MEHFEAPGEDRIRESGVDEEACRRYFGTAWKTISRFAGMLAGTGVTRGLIGPRERERLWSRHLLNCGAVAVALPAAGTILDVGSGAGLPGIVLAATRPELSFELVEPMARRSSWLIEVAGDLGLDNVTVTRARAEELAGRRSAEVVVSRAVAPLRRLAGWSAPLLAEGGRMLAVKGRHAVEELAAAKRELQRCNLTEARVLELSSLPGVESTRLVSARRRRR